MAGAVRGWFHRHIWLMAFVILACGVALSLKVGFGEVRDRQNSDSREVKHRAYALCVAANRQNQNFLDYLGDLAHGVPTASIDVNDYNIPPEYIRFVTDSRAATRAFNANALITAQVRFKTVDCKK